MSNLVKHANREFDIIGYPQLTRAEMRSKDPIMSDEGWDKAVRRSVIEIIEMFSTQGHSGTSAAQVVALLHQLLQYKPLSPLTNDPDEWMKVARNITSEDVWQNRRNSEAFSTDGGKTFYLLGKKRKWVFKLYHMLPKSSLKSWVWSHKNWLYKIHTSQVA